MASLRESPALLIAPEVYSSVAGLAMLAAVVAVQLPRRRRATSPTI
jgi:hypothetical protein